MRYAYPVRLEPQPEGGFTVTFDGVPGVTEGDTEEEALHNAADALITILWSYVEDGLPIPPAPKARGRRMVGVAALQAVKLALHDAMIEAGMTNVDLARRLGVDEKVVRRLRDPMHRSHIGEVERALRELGRTVDVEVREVA